MGLSFFNDNVGNVLSENKLSIDYAYILNLDSYNKLSLGLKGGFNMLNLNFDNFKLESGDQYSDDLFAVNQSRLYPNIGAGFFYYSKEKYLGFSIPNFVKSSYIKKTDNIYSKSSDEIHMYLTGGYVFEFDRQNIKLKPSFMAKATAGSKIALDIAMNAQFNENFELGLSHRINNSVSALANVYVTDNLRIGYSYDYTVNNLTKFNSGSHELVLLYDINLYGTNSKSPRFF
jgi:type IX secretion system PorP/SprF family membrane protein